MGSSTSSESSASSSTTPSFTYDPTLEYHLVFDSVLNGKTCKEVLRLNVSKSMLECLNTSQSTDLLRDAIVVHQTAKAVKVGKRKRSTNNSSDQKDQTTGGFAFQLDKASRASAQLDVVLEIFDSETHELVCVEQACLWRGTLMDADDVTHPSSDCLGTIMAYAYSSKDGQCKVLRLFVLPVRTLQTFVCVAESKCMTQSATRIAERVKRVKSEYEAVKMETAKRLAESVKCVNIECKAVEMEMDQVERRIKEIEVQDAYVSRQIKNGQV